jgi:SnoaL-like domain
MLAREHRVALAPPPPEGAQLIPAPTAPDVTAAAHTAAEAWVDAFTEGWRETHRPQQFAAHFRPLLAPDVRLLQPGIPTLVGHDAFERHFVRPLFALMPDARGAVEAWAARGGRIYIELTLTGTLASPLLAAVAAHPSTWPRFLRLSFGPQLANLTKRRMR